MQKAAELSLNVHQGLFFSQESLTFRGICQELPDLPLLLVKTMCSAVNQGNNSLIKTHTGGYCVHIPFQGKR